MENYFQKVFPPNIRALLPLLLLFSFSIFSGCAGGMAKRVVWLPNEDVNVADVLAGDWLGGGAERTCQLQARITLGSRRVMLDGMLKLSPEKGLSHLVLLAPMGITFIDIEITPSGNVLHDLAPDLKQAQQVPRHVARTVRRIFLPPPVADDDIRAFREQAPDCGWIMLESRVLGSDGETVRRIYETSGDKPPEAGADGGPESGLVRGVQGVPGARGRFPGAGAHSLS